MKIERILMYAIPIVGAVALLYYLMTRPPTVAVPVTPTPPAAAPPVGVPSYVGVPAMDPTSQLLAMAEQQCGLTGESVVVRGLRPQDLGINNFMFTSTLVNTWEAWINTTVADCTFIAITGISYLGTNFSQLRVQAGAAYVAYPNLAFISGLVSAIYFFPQPIIIEQNQPIMIDVISKAAATEGVSLMGIVAEKRGVVVAP